MKKVYALAGAVALGLAFCQPVMAEDEEINDSKTPLHLLRPDYKIPYGQLAPETVKADVDRIFTYIDRVTPAKVVDANGREVKNLKKLPDDALLNQGTYRLTSYEWGVTYLALLDAARMLGDSKYSDYVADRVGFLSQAAPAFADLYKRTGRPDGQMRQVIAPASLDDAGAMSGAFMEAKMALPQLKNEPEIERYYAIVDNGVLHLPDGTIARNRPHYNAVWLDDMFMALPAMISRSKYTGDEKYLDSAAIIASGFIDCMWMPEKRIFRHGYVEGHEDQPSLAWGRANGWGILTLCRILDALPESHPQYQKLMNTYRDHVRGLAALQGKDGFWHQLLDRSDSYPETSATAIFAYALAHGVNQGWLDPTIYGPVAQLAWEAVSTKINKEGEVEDVCVGTGMGFDPAYYYYRPVSVKAAHGYGPAIWAGSEIYKMLTSAHPKLNDSAVHYYGVDPETDEPIFSLDKDGKGVKILH